jgi:transposase-like protein
LGARNNQLRYRTMTRKNNNRTISEIKAMMAEDGEFLRPLVHAVIQEFLEADMAEAVGAEKRACLKRQLLPKRRSRPRNSRR